MVGVQIVEWQRKIPSLSTMTYLDNAGTGLPPLSVTEAMKRIIDDWAGMGEHWDVWLQDVVEMRKLFAELIGAKASEVGVIPSASVGLTGLASSVDFSKRKKVVTSSLNFPTNVVLWQRMTEAGVLKRAEVLRSKGGTVPIEAYEEAVDDDTAVVSVDYVSWFSGYCERIREISEIAHSHGALLVVDAFHALGVFPFDVKHDGVDGLVSRFYKWMCGPHGVACLYVAEDVLEELEPTYVGWHGVEGNVIERVQAGRDPFDVPFSFDSAKPSSTASRFEWGTWSVVFLIGALEALKFALQSGVAARFRRISELKERLRNGLEDMGVRILAPGTDVNPGSGIITYEAENSQDLVKDLAEKRVFVSSRFGDIRVSPHFYDSPEHIDRFWDAVSSSQHVS